MVEGKKAAKYRVREEELRESWLEGQERQDRQDRTVFPSRLSCPSCPTCSLYFAVIMKCPRRFCCQQDSFFSVQNGCSLPLLTIVMRLAGTPRFTR